MSIIEQLASSLDRRDEEPNIELAERIVASNDAGAVKELVENLKGRDKNIRSDCIKVLYEVGARSPGLIAGFWKEFAALLEGTDNRLAWGAMTALDYIASENPKAIHGILPEILAAADSGSVITRDRAVNILIKLDAVKAYADQMFSLLIEQLRRCPTNQLPMYAENVAPRIDPARCDLFVDTLRSRLDEVEKESKRKRIEKVIRKMVA